MAAERDREALLAAVRADPDDDLPRLALADWLDEHADGCGRDWARLIRVQCEEARLGRAEEEGEDITGRAALTAEAKAILMARHRALRAGLPAGGGFDFMFRRGLPDYAYGPASEVLKRADRAFAAAPVTKLQLQGTGEEVAAVIAAGHAGRVRELDIQVASDPESGALVAAAWALAAADLPSLRALGLWGTGSADAQAGAAVAVLAEGSWSALESLTVVGAGELEAGYVRALAVSAPGLRELALGGIGPRPLPRAVAAVASRFPRLRRLEFNGDDLDDAAANAIARSGALAGLRHLHLSGSVLCEPVSLLRLLTAPKLADLTSLHLHGSGDPLSLAARRPPR
ncbi:MAG: TIGR02996 domain-containing protein, partial [Gemmataceae bacterium]